MTSIMFIISFFIEKSFSFNISESLEKSITKFEKWYSGTAGSLYTDPAPGAAVILLISFPGREHFTLRKNQVETNFYFRSFISAAQTVALRPRLEKGELRWDSEPKSEREKSDSVAAGSLTIRESWEPTFLTGLQPWWLGRAGQAGGVQTVPPRNFSVHSQLRLADWFFLEIVNLVWVVPTYPNYCPPVL